MQTPEEIIRRLALAPLEPEGGFFRETYRSAESTAIYYLLTPDTFSALHRLPGDELYHFYLGDPVDLLLLGPDGTGRRVRIGSDLARGETPQVVVPGGTWQGARLADGGRVALLGTTMAPGFDFAHYEGADRAALLDAFPDHASHIARLTAPSGRG